jgi:hypothetical protein
VFGNTGSDKVERQCRQPRQKASCSVVAQGR